MKTKNLNWAAMALMPAVILTFTSCSSTPKGGTETTATAQEGVPGGTVVETYKTKATVIAIDAVSRKVTIETPDGKKSKITCGPEVANFNQIQVGDQVKATVTKKVAVSLLEPGATRSPGQSSTVALAPKGAKPGIVVAETVEATARVEALDLKKRKVTLRFPDGDAETFDVRKDVDMSQAHLGQEVLIRSTEAVAVRVEKP
jgi:translation elongation factor P/translation initiation factor 5A